MKNDFLLHYNFYNEYYHPSRESAFCDVARADSASGIADRTYNDAVWEILYMTMYAYLTRSAESYLTLVNLGDELYRVTENNTGDIILKENMDLSVIREELDRIVDWGAVLIVNEHQEVSKQERKNCIYSHAEYLVVALRGAWDSQGDLGKYRTDIDVPYN